MRVAYFFYEHASEIVTTSVRSQTSECDRLTFAASPVLSSLLGSAARRSSSAAAILEAMKASINSCVRWPTIQGMVSSPCSPNFSTGRNEITDSEIGRVFWDAMSRTAVKSARFNLSSQQPRKFIARYTTCRATPARISRQICPKGVEVMSSCTHTSQLSGGGTHARFGQLFCRACIPN